MLNSSSAAAPTGATPEQLFNARPIGSALFQSVIGLVVTTSRQNLSSCCPSRTESMLSADSVMRRADSLSASARLRI
jgi:hypothetical protein